MYISVPKNYGGSAFPHPDAPPRGAGGMPRPGAPFAPSGTQAQPSPPPPPPRPMMHGGAPTPVAPLGKIPRDCPPPPPPDCGCEPPPPPCDDREPCGTCVPEDAPPCGDAPCAPPCPAKSTNPLTCLFEALRGRKKSGFDADDFLLIALIALLMGKEGSEDIVLILALLLLM